MPPVLSVTLRKHCVLSGGAACAWCGVFLEAFASSVGHLVALAKPKTGIPSGRSANHEGTLAVQEASCAVRRALLAVRVSTGGFAEFANVLGKSSISREMTCHTGAFAISRAEC